MLFGSLVSFFKGGLEARSHACILFYLEATSELGNRPGEMGFALSRHYK